MKLFLFLFYETAKLLLWGVRWFYYGERTLVNRKTGNYKGPCILVSNHPGTFMDPINAAIMMNRRVNFLANASLFTTPFTNWFFSTFYCIKVERYQDTGGKPLNNIKAFEMATDYLTNGGCLYIAPEGGSYAGRQVNKFKTGAARIAFNTEQANGFDLNLVFLPVGLNYSDPGRFRSPLLTIMGEPIRVADFQADWERDRVEAVRNLTLHLKGKMKEILIDANDEEEDRLLEQAENILENDEKLPADETFRRSKKILKGLQDWRATDHSRYDDFKRKAGIYFSKLGTIASSDVSVKGIRKAPVGLMVLAMPFFLAGYLIHILPSWITGILSHRLSSEASWIPTYKILGGFIIYPLFLVMQSWLLGIWLPEIPHLKWIYFLSIIPAGLAAEWFLKQWTLFQGNRRFRELEKKKPKEAKQFQELRKALATELSTILAQKTMETPSL